MEQYIKKLISDGILLQQDIFTTFKVKHKGKNAVLKLFSDKSYINNELEILSLLHRYNKIYPKLYFSYNEEFIVNVENKEVKVFQVLCYEFIEGTLIEEDITEKHKRDLLFQLGELHNLGFVHGDVGVTNIIIRKDDKKAFLIDYGNSLNVNITNLMSMGTDDPTMGHDMNCLFNLFDIL